MSSMACFLPMYSYSVPPKSFVRLYLPSENAPAPPKPFMIAQVGQPMQCLTVLPSMGHLRFSSGWPSSNTAIFLSGQSFESS